MILISDQTPELIDVLGALQSFLGNLEAKTVIVIDGQSELVKALLDAKKIDYVEAPGGLANAPAFDLGAGLRKATPMTNSDWVKEPVNVAPVENVALLAEEKICPECGNAHGGKGVFCSKSCYMKDYFRRNPKKIEKPGCKQCGRIGFTLIKGLCSNCRKAQNKQLGMAPDERIEANIDRIVANAKDNPEGANIEKTVMARGTLHARKVA